MRNEGELVLIHYQDKPALYARIEAIELDVKKDWYRLTLLLLTIPSQVVTWILREEYIDGETFTMGGHAVRLAEVQGAPDEVEGAVPLRRKKSRVPLPRSFRSKANPGAVTSPDVISFFPKARQGPEVRPRQRFKGSVAIDLGRMERLLLDLSG